MYETWQHWFVLDVEESDDEQDDDSGIMNGNGLGVPNRKRELSSRRGSVRIIVEEWKWKACAAIWWRMIHIWRTDNNHIWKQPLCTKYMNMDFNNLQPTWSCNFLLIDKTKTFEYLLIVLLLVMLYKSTM